MADLKTPGMQLDWNAGGWFGSQLGGTAWILIAAAIALGQDIATGSILVVLFIVPNFAGLLLWQQRKLSCYASIQTLFALCGCCGMLAIHVLDRNDLWLEIQQAGAISAKSGYFLLGATVILIMVSFHLKFGRRGNQSSI